MHQVLAGARGAAPAALSPRCAPDPQERVCLCVCGRVCAGALGGAGVGRLDLRTRRASRARSGGANRAAGAAL